MKSALIALAALLLTMECTAADEPSFNCTTASTPVEKTICEEGNWGLAMRDGALGRLYAALKEQGGHDDVLTEQNSWLAKRDACGTDISCLETRYDERLAVLARAAGDERRVTGTYGYALSAETNQGILFVVREADGTLSGNIDSVSGQGLNTCEIGFDEARELGDAWLWIGPKEEGEPEQGECHILFRPGQQSIRVDSFDCQYYCGANAWFDEAYKRQR